MFLQPQRQIKKANTIHKKHMNVFGFTVGQSYCDILYFPIATILFFIF